MAPAISSSSAPHSFPLTATTTLSSILASPRRLAVFAKQPGPSKDKPNSNSKPNPFRFDFGEIPNVKSLIPVVSSSSPGLFTRRKDPGTVFVACATGQVGIRIAQTLLRQGFSVRAGVPKLDDAQDLALLASTYKIISNVELKRLNAVQCSFQDAESIAKSIGNASKVAVTIGPCEYGPDSEFTTSDALLVIRAAQLAGVGHVAIVYDGNVGTASASPNGVLSGISSFFNNLFSRSQPLTVAEFLEEVIETDVNYTLIKTSLTEDFSPESSYKVVVSAEGSADPSDYKVGKSRIACMVGDIFSNTAVAENKVVEVSTNPSSPSRSTDELFSAIPEDGRRKVKAEEEAKVGAERAQKEEAKKREEEVKRVSKQETRTTSLAEEKAVAATGSLLEKAKDIGSGLSWDKFSSQVATSVQKSVEIPKMQIDTAQTLPSKKAVTKQSAPKPRVPKPKEEPAKPKTEVRKVFGGMFKQETIYVDDD